MKKSGFTLIELLVVIAIISVLATILLPALSMARQMANDVKCVTNMRAISTAVHLYAQDNDGVLVPARWSPHPKSPPASPGGTAWFWDFLSANYLLSDSWDEWNWEKAPAFYCPVSEAPAWAVPIACNRSLMYGAYAWGSGILRLEDIKPDAALIMDGNGLSALVGPPSIATFWLNSYTADPNDTWVDFRHTGSRANVITASGVVESLAREELEDDRKFASY